MRHTTVTRKEMIRKLVTLSVDTALGESQRYWLSELFEKGFVGYGNFSDAELLREMQLRGLAQPEDELAEDLADDDVDDEIALDALAHTAIDFHGERQELE